LLLDNNRVSGWSTWEPVQPGMYVEIELPQPTPVSEIRITAGSPDPIELYGKAKTWIPLPLPGRPFTSPPLNLRQAAVRLLRREAITHILAVEGTDSFGLIGTDMIKAPKEWNLAKVAGIGDVVLFRLSP
jgi:hypothetical protein